MDLVSFFFFFIFYYRSPTLPLFLVWMMLRWFWIARWCWCWCCCNVRKVWISGHKCRHQATASGNKARQKSEKQNEILNLAHLMLWCFNCKRIFRLLSCNCMSFYPQPPITMPCQAKPCNAEGKKTENGIVLHHFPSVLYFVLFRFSTH